MCLAGLRSHGPPQSGEELSKMLYLVLRPQIECWPWSHTQLWLLHRLDPDLSLTQSHDPGHGHGPLPQICPEHWPWAWTQPWAGSWLSPAGSPQMWSQRRLGTYCDAPVNALSRLWRAHTPHSQPNRASCYHLTLAKEPQSHRPDFKSNLCLAEWLWVSSSSVLRNLCVKWGQNPCWQDDGKD